MIVLKDTSRNKKTNGIVNCLEGQWKNMKDINSEVKIYLDDERPAPPGWVLVRRAKDAIDLLINLEVKEISLDHDLGDDEAGTGYTIVLWIEEKVMTDENYIPPIIHIHTSNPSARIKMEQGVKSIERRR